MDARRDRENLRRLRLFADEVELSPEKVAGLMRPFSEEWKTVAVPNVKDAAISNDPAYTLTAHALADVGIRIRTMGMNLNKAGVKGLAYHNTLLRQIAALAGTFDCRGWTEAPASFDDPEREEEEGEEASPLAGRVDVIWARERVPVVVFEVDSTVKARSLQKLKEAAAPHKVWVYFGKDVWNFRMFLQKHDPERAVTGVLVPRTFIPSFGE